MQEQSVMEVIKWFTTFFFLMMIIAITSFLMQAQDINSIKQSVNYTIERNGGLTHEAVDYLDELSESSYGGRFKVYGLVEDTNGSVTMGNKKYRVSSNPTGEVAFGEKVNYVIDMKFNVPFLNTFNFDGEGLRANYKGTSVSQIR